MATLDYFFIRDSTVSEAAMTVNSRQREMDSEESESDCSESLSFRKVYKRGFKTSWLDKFVWLKYTGEKMYCKYCEEAKKKNSYTSGCMNFRISHIQKHGKSRDHSAATEAYLLKSSGATVTHAVTRLTTMNEEAVLAAMRNIYWLAKEDVASLKYNSLNELTKLQGCNAITHLYVGGNAKYSSPEVVTEMQIAISQSIKDEVKEEMQQSSVYGIMIDEATDISTNASLIVYAYFVHDGKRKMRYLADVQLEGCDASSILTVILRVLEDYEVSIKKCFGFGSDGASIMTGRENGVFY